MSAESPLWRRRVHNETPLWGTSTFLPYNVLKDIQLFGESGRPLGESPRYNPARVPFEPASNLSDGGRENKIVNRSAFDEVAGVYPESLGLISHIRNLILPYGSEVTPDAALNVINTVLYLPHWLVMKADNPMQNGLVPTYITAATKVAEGAGRLYSNYIFSELGMADSYKNKKNAKYRRLTQAEPYVDEIFSRGHLVSKTPRGKILETACPAPWQMVMDFADILFENPSNMQGEMGNTLGLSDAEIQRASQFGSSFRRIEFMDRLLLEIFKDPRRQQQLQIGDIPMRLVTGERVNFLEYAVEIITAHEQKMNVALGRRITEPTVPQGFIRRQ